jgi:hypothetical protein
MRRKWSLVLASIMLSLVAFTAAQAVGEDVLAVTGQYTFFIKPDPSSCTTYYQKMVPCIKKITVPVPVASVPVYPVPMPMPRRKRVMLDEVPVGHAKGAGPCVRCRPAPSHRPATKNVFPPVPVPVPVPGMTITPKCVARRVMLPQWFKVDERPMPRPRKIRKVSGPR